MSEENKEVGYFEARIGGSMLGHKDDLPSSPSFLFGRPVGGMAHLGWLHGAEEREASEKNNQSPTLGHVDVCSVKPLSPQQDAKRWGLLYVIVGAAACAFMLCRNVDISRLYTDPEKAQTIVKDVAPKISKDQAEKRVMIKGREVSVYAKPSVTSKKIPMSEGNFLYLDGVLQYGNDTFVRLRGVSLSDKDPMRTTEYRYVLRSQLPADKWIDALPVVSLNDAGKISSRVLQILPKQRLG